MPSTVYILVGDALHRTVTKTRTVVAVGQIRGSVHRIETMLHRFRDHTEPATRGFLAVFTPPSHMDSCRTEPNPGPRAPLADGSERGSSPRGSTSAIPNEIATTRGARPSSSACASTPSPAGGGTLTRVRRPEFHPYCRTCRFRYATEPNGMCTACARRPR